MILYDDPEWDSGLVPDVGERQALRGFSECDRFGTLPIVDDPETTDSVDGQNSQIDNQNGESQTTGE